MYACNTFSTQFRKIILRYIKIGYNMNVIRQTACMVVNTVNNFAPLFRCRPGLRLYGGSGLKTFKKVGCSGLGRTHRSPTVLFIYLFLFFILFFLFLFFFIYLFFFLFASAFQLFLAVESSSLLHVCIFFFFFFFFFFFMFSEMLH